MGESREIKEKGKGEEKEKTWKERIEKWHKLIYKFGGIKQLIFQFLLFLV